jgi:hypothetical protein
MHRSAVGVAVTGRGGSHLLKCYGSPSLYSSYMRLAAISLVSFKVYSTYVLQGFVVLKKGLFII